MNKSFEDLQSGWKKSRQAHHPDLKNVDDLVSLASSKRRSNLYFHYGNIGVLTLTVLALILVWQLWMPFRDVMSVTGIGIMIGSLVLRIILEAISAAKSKNIDLLESTRETNQEMIRYYTFRKAMHGPVTVAIIIAYLLGIGLLLPEVSEYIPFLLIAVFMTAFVVSGMFIIYKVRQGIKKEMDNLRFFLTIDRGLQE